MVSIQDGPNVPFLPPEIHLVISEYIHCDDLPNYRLASKEFAEAGKAALFHTVTLRFSFASLARLKHIQQNEQLCKLVHTLIWDHNYWRIGLDVRDWHEWTRYSNRRAKRAEESDLEQSALYKELAESRQHWMDYLSRLEDEKEAIKEVENGFGVDLLHRLHNLQKIIIVKGAYQLINRRIFGAGEYGSIPVTAPLSSWKGDSLSLSSRNHAYRSVLYATSAQKWRFDGIAGKELDLLLSAAPRHLTSVRITLGEREVSHFSIDTDLLATYISRLYNLESLHLDLRGRVFHEVSMTRAVRTIQDTFETSKMTTSYPKGPFTLRKLRKLSLRYFDSTTRALLSLVARHSATLRDLRLHSISLCAETLELTPLPWPEIFKTIGATTNLEKVVLSGEFLGQSSSSGKWDLDDEPLASAVAAWIMNGGECPLTKENEIEENCEIIH